MVQDSTKRRKGNLRKMNSQGEPSVLSLSPPGAFEGTRGHHSFKIGSGLQTLGSPKPSETSKLVDRVVVHK